MDLRTVVTISTLLLMTAGSDPDLQLGFTAESNSTTSTNSTTSNCSCPRDTTIAPPPTSSSAPALGLLTIRWTKKCEGHVTLTLHRPSNSSSPVCYDSKTNIEILLGNVCENKKGCINPRQWIESGAGENSYLITESGAQEEPRCKTLKVQCTAEVFPDLHGPLHAYKVVTALLCCVLLVLLLIRFTKPTVKALQKRLSDRRQNRWIGPTQSHSVSYHRGKTAVKNDGEKRLSYPALERLAVSDSREPSSNRNSDYNF